MTPASVGILSDDQKIALASELLSQCPPGEFADVLQDIDVILNDNELLFRLQETIEKRNISNGALVVVKMGDEELPLILTEFNRLSDGRFVDPNAGVIARIDPFNLEVEEINSEPKCQDGLRLALDSAVREYLRTVLPRSNFMLHFDPNRATYGIVIVGEQFQLQNMRNGQWYSSWKFSPQNSQVKGMVRVMVHYFEDGNVQLSSDRECSFEFDSSSFGDDLKALAKALVVKIRTKEDEVQLAINEAYSQLAETTFKKLRRQLPITRSKIDWSKLSSYRVGDQLSFH